VGNILRNQVLLQTHTTFIVLSIVMQIHDKQYNILEKQRNNIAVGTTLIKAHLR